MILLKVYQRLYYFPEPQTIPGAVISQIRAVMKLEADLVPDISPATLQHYHVALREHLEITTLGKQALQGRRNLVVLPERERQDDCVGLECIPQRRGRRPWVQSPEPAAPTPREAGGSRRPP
jgi:hypothetical protein